MPGSQGLGMRFVMPHTATHTARLAVVRHAVACKATGVSFTCFYLPYCWYVPTVFVRHPLSPWPGALTGTWDLFLCPETQQAVVAALQARLQLTCSGLFAAEQHANRPH